MRQTCIRVHGHDRAGEVRDALADGSAAVVERHGRITGYTIFFVLNMMTIGLYQEPVGAYLPSVGY